MSDSKHTLAPCPFCAHTEASYGVDEDGRKYAYCRNCYSAGSSAHTKRAAAKNWNERASAAEIFASLKDMIAEVEAAGSVSLGTLDKARAAIARAEGRQP